MISCFPTSVKKRHAPVVVARSDLRTCVGHVLNFRDGKDKRKPKSKLCIVASTVFGLDYAPGLRFELLIALRKCRNFCSIPWTARPQIARRDSRLMLRSSIPECCTGVQRRHLLHSTSLHANKHCSSSKDSKPITGWSRTFHAYTRVSNG